MTQQRTTLTLRETARAAPRWAALYLPSHGLDSLVEALWMFTLGWEAARAGWATGLVLAAGTVPAVAFVLWGGSLADRFGAHRVTVWTMLGRVLAMTGWAVIVASDTAPAYLAAAVAAVVGTIAGVHDPAVGAMSKLVVPPAGREASENARRLVLRVVQTAGPAIGGGIAAWLGMSATVVATAAVALLPLAGFALLRRALTAGRDGAAASSAGSKSDNTDGLADRSLWAGLRWILKNPAIRRTLSVQAVMNLTTASIIMASLPRQAQLFGWGPGIYGLAAGAFGGGMVLGTIAAFPIRDGFRKTASSAMRAERRKVPIAIACAGLANVLVIATGTAHTPVWAILAAGLMGVASGPLGSVVTGWTLSAVERSDEHVYGRVYSVMVLVTTAAEPLGYLVFSLLAAAASLKVASVAFGVVGIIVVAIALGSRDVRTSQAV